MMGLVKMAGLSAVLAAGLVTAFDAPQAVATTTTTVKTYEDRVAPEPAGPVVLAQANRLTVSDAAPVEASCRSQTWPYVSTECAGAEGRKPVRTITIERRDTANTSTLVRLPAGAAAAR